MSTVDAPTQQQHAVPAPTEGPAPAGRCVHPHKPGSAGDRHPHYGWLLIPRELRAPADYRMPARPADAITAVIPAVQSTEGHTA